MLKGNCTKLQANNLLGLNSKIGIGFRKSFGAIISSIVFLLLLMPFLSNAQSMLTTPTSLYNYQTDTTGDKDVCVAISEDGNVVVKGSQFANGRKGAVTLYFRDNYGIWTSDQLPFPTDYKTPFFSFLMDPVNAGARNYGGPNRKNLLGNINSAFGVANSAINAGITGVKNTAAYINGDFANEDINFGSSVAISADGSTIVVGAKNTNGTVGAFWIYKRDSVNRFKYSQFKDIMYPLDYEGKPKIGTAVAVSGDGSRIIVGGPEDNLKVSIFESCDGTIKIPLVNKSITLPFTSNRVPIWFVSKSIDYLFEKAVEKVTKQTDELGPVAGPIAAYTIERFFDWVVKPPVYGWMNDQLGIKTEEYEREQVGAAWVFKLSDDKLGYEQEGDKLQNKGRDGLLPPIVLQQSNLGPAQTTLDSINGSSTSINSMLTRINQITTAMDPINDLFSFTGLEPFPSVDIPPYVGTRDVNIEPIAGSQFYDQLLELKNATNSRLFEKAFQGSSVSISKDGKTVMMGAPGLIDGNGVTYVYQNTSGTWDGQDVMVGSELVGASAFGSSLAISSDGANAVVGAPKTLLVKDTIGAAWIFKKDNSGRWNKVGSRITPFDYTLGSNKKIGVGTSVCISSDNNDIIIGAPFDNNGKGAVWLYKPISGYWIKDANKLTPSGVSNSNFGSSIAVGEYGLTLVAGAPNLSVGGNAYVYNSCEPPKPILTQYSDVICSNYQFNKYYQNNYRLNSATNWVWRLGSTSAAVFAPGVGDSVIDHYLLKNSFPGNTTFYVRAEGGCVNGLFDSIKTIVKPTPTITSVTPTYICSPGGQVTLKATANSGTIKWIGSTWDGLRYGFHDFYESNPNYTAPYNYYIRNTDPKQTAYGSGVIEASGNTYKPTISNSRNYVVSSLLNGCWSDTASVNARIERIVTKTGSDQEKIVCDDGFTHPLNVNITAPDIAAVRYQQITSVVDQQIPTQLPITYNFFRHDFFNKSYSYNIQSSTNNQLVYDIVGASPSTSKFNIHYTMTNACGTSSPVYITVKTLGKGDNMKNAITIDSVKVCPTVKPIIYVNNDLVTSAWGNTNFSYRFYDSLTGNNLLDTALPIIDNSTGFFTKSIFKAPYGAVANKNYYVTVRNECGESPRKIIPLILDSIAPPNIKVNNAKICGSGSVTLTTESNEGSIYWYDRPNLSNQLAPTTAVTTEIYTTPFLTADKIYWVRPQVPKCPTTPFVPIYVDVYSQPTITVNTTNYYSCKAGDEVALNASAPAGIIKWYESDTNSLPIATGGLVRVYPTKTTTYYVEVDNYCKTAKIPVTVTVYDNLQITQIIPGSRANSGTVVLGATSNIGTPVWTATDGSVLGYGNSFTTNNISTNTTYYVAATANGCTSVRLPVLATVNYVPIVNTSMNASRCGAGSVTLSASAEVGTIRWFDANYNQVGTGNTFTTPSLTTTTTYYAQSWYFNANNQYDKSAFVPVKAYIYVIDNPAITYGSGCAGQQPRVNISLPQMSVKYSLRNGTTVLDSKFANGINNNFDLIAPAISSATTYNVYAEKYDSSTALNFDGDNDYVEILNHAGLNPLSNFMLAAWINRNDIQKNNYIISKGSYSGNNGYSLSILNDYKLTLDIGSQRFQTTATIPASTWTHVAASYDGNTVKLYINGGLSASFTAVGSINVNQGNLIIGSSQDYLGDANYGFSGKIDEVAVFCGVNFNTPIADIMNGKLVGNEYGLIAYYNFEHGANISNLVDICSNAGANNGILKNIDSVNAWVSGAPINYCSAQISSSTLNPIVIPSIVNTISPSRVGPGPVTLTAFSSTGATTKWYSDSALTNNVFTGNNYAVALLNYTTKFFALANNGCNSPVVSVTATVNDYPEEQQINCINSNTDIALFDNINLNASVDAIVRVGQYLFVGNGNAIINVYSVGSGSLTYVSSLDLMGGTIHHLEAANGLLYASDRGKNQLFAIDFSDVTNLKLLGVSNFPLNQGTSFCITQYHAFVSSRDDQMLYQVSLGNPKNMYQVYGLRMNGTPYDVKKKDNTLYVSVENVGVTLVDVSGSPFISSTISLSGTAAKIFVKGNYLYVSQPVTNNVTPYNTVLKVYDISNAASPFFVRDVSLPDGYAISYTADSKYLYLGTYSQATGTRKLHILSIANPSNPIIVVSKTISNSDGMAVRLGHIYTIGSSISDYAVTTAPSITNTKSAFRYGPGTVVLSATATSGTINWYTAVSGGASLGTGTNFTTPSISATTTYYVGSTDGSCTSARTPVVASIVDIPPCIASSSDIGSATTNTTSLDIKSMYRSGNFIFLTGSSWIYAYNISSGTPVLVSTLDIGGPAMINDIKVVNNYLFAVARYSEKVHIIDISNPSQMQIVGVSSSIFNIPNAIWVEGNFAYVNNGDNHSLDVINIANIGNPTRVGQLTGLGDPAKGIQKKGNILYLANYTYGISVIDVTNPTSPTLVQHINSKEGGDPIGAQNLYVIGNYLYVASAEGAAPRIKIYDISNPTSPSLVNTITTAYNVLSFDYDGIYLYCGLRKYNTSGDNINVYRMNNLASPTLVGTARTPSQTSVVGVAATSIANNGRIFAAATSFPGGDIVAFPVNNSGTITAVSANSRCGTGSVSLQATASAGTITWYSDSAATNTLGTGGTFNTPSISVPTTYYVNSTGNGCSLPTIPVLATVNPVPLITNMVESTRRDTGTVDLQATANTGLLTWYNVATGGTPLDYGTSFTTPVINNTTTFYVESQGTLCTSTRVPVVATVITSPVIRTVTKGSRCLAGVDTLYATASIGTINWYDSYGSTTSIATGTRFITPSLSTSKTYYVTATNNGEISARVSVGAFVGKTAANANVGADITNFCGNNVTLNADSINGSFGIWTVISGTATVDTATSLKPKITGIVGSVNLEWRVSSAFCPDNVDTLKIIVAKPKPIFYTRANSSSNYNGATSLARYDRNTDSLTSIHPFYGSPDGKTFNSGLLLASNKKMYGTTEGGGANGYGVIFEFDPKTNQYNVVYDGFNTGSVGRSPGTLIEASPGVLYGTAGGGDNNNGVIFKFNYNTKQYTVLQQGNASTGADYPSKLTLVGNKVYGIARNLNGLNSGGCIFSIDTATNIYTVNLVINSAYNGHQITTSLCLGPDGNLYTVGFNTTLGTSSIYKYSISANTFTSVYDFPTNGSMGNNFYGNYLFLASNNKFYFTATSNGANGNGTILEFDPIANTVTKKMDFASAISTRGGGSFMQSSDGYLYSISTGGGTYGNGAFYRYSYTANSFEIIKQLNCNIACNYSTPTEFPISDADAGTDQNICGRITKLAAVSPVYGTGTWTVIKGAATIANPNSATSSITVSTDTTILRWTVADGLCYTSFDDVQIISKAAPVISSTSVNCNGGNGTYILNAVAAGATLNWYADNTSTTVLGTGNNFSVTPGSAVGYMYVDATINGCTSARQSVSFFAPLITSTRGGSRCNQGTVLLQATANASLINWYTTATGGSVIGTGTNFTTPSISGTAVYYAEASNLGCSSARVAVTANIGNNNNNAIYPVTYSASSIFNTQQSDENSCPNNAYKLFTTALSDSDLTTGIGTLNYTGESWIQAKFAAATTVTKVKLAGGSLCAFNVLNGNATAGVLNGSLLQYSNDGANWTTVTTVSGVTDNAIATISVGSITAQYWRLYKSGNNYVAANEFSFDPMPTTISPLMADAGPDQTNCSNVFTVSGNTPTSGAGVWSVAFGTATIANPNSPTTTVTTSSKNVILRWSFNSTSCGITADEVVLTNTSKSPLLWGSMGDRKIFSYNTITNTLKTQYTAGGGKDFSALKTIIKTSTNRIFGLSATGGANNTGLLFEYLPGTGTVIPVHSFQNSSIGGLTEYNGSIFGYMPGALFAYNFNTNTYQEYGIPSNAIGASQAPYSKLTVAGNLLYGLTVNSIYSLDPATGTITHKYVIPGGNSYASAFVLASNGKLYATASSGGTSNQGSIFEYDYINNVFTVKYNFSGSDGSNAGATMCLANNNKLYGTCGNGGPNSGGTLFEYDYINNSFTRKYSFVNGTGTDGSFPSANGVIQASDVNLYGLTSNGGTSGNGVLYKFNISNNSYTPLSILSEQPTGGSTLIDYSVLTANAGPDQTVCSSTTIMAANTPFEGTGTWSVVSGTATITSINSPTTTVTGIKGTAVLRWTVSYGSSCASTAYDDVVITALPGVTAVTNGARCGTGTVTLGATAPSGTINWYATATGGTSLGTGSTFTTPSISTTTTYYVDATNNFCTRTAVTATILSSNFTATVPAINSKSVCNGSSVNLTATASLTDVATIQPYSTYASSVITYSSQYSNPPNWSAAKLLGAPDVYPSYGDIANAWSPVSAYSPREYFVLGFTNAQPINYISIYETYNPGGVDTVYVKNPNTGLFEIVYTGTASAAPTVARINKISFPITSFPVSEVRVAMSNSFVNNWKEIDAVEIGVAGSGVQAQSPVPTSQGTFKWYAAATGGTSIWTGSTFMTPPLSTTTTYYVDVTYNGCATSSRTPVTATVVSSSPATPTITANGSTAICNGNSVTLTSQLSGAGNVNSGVSVNNGAIRILDNNALDFTTKYTFESWINIAAYQYGTIMSKFDDDNNNRGLMINMGETGDNTKICVTQTSDGGWTNPIQWNTGYTPSLNTWTHIAVVFDGTLSSNQIKLYVNGVLYSQTTWNYTLQPNAANVYLGGYDGAGNGLNSGANSRFLNGKLDEVRFWNTARTQTEISNNKDAEIANATGLVGYYKLNENTGTTVIDFSSTSNNGTFSASGVTWSAPGVSYLWSPNGETTSSITASTAGNYSVTITDVNGCSATSAATTVTLNGSGIVANAGPDQVNCSGSFTMAGNGTGTWSVVSGTATITNANSPTTTVTVTSSSAVLRWTTNNSCGITTDDVVLTKTSSAPILLYPTTNEPNCTYCDVGAFNLFDVNRNDVISKKLLNGGSTPSGLDYLYRASDGILYGIANGYVYSNGQTDYTSNVFYYDPITNKPISITNLTTSNYLRNITEYNGQLYIVMAKANTISRIYIVNMSSKQATSLSFPSNVISGNAPASGLTVVGNKMYGTTYYGIYELNPANNTFTWKYSFSSASLGGIDNANSGELILAANGKLYGKTLDGGANGYGTLYEYDIASNTATAKVNFATSSTGSRSIRSAVLVSNNLIYGTCQEGGANNRGTLWEYNTSTNTFSVKYHFTLVNGTSNQLMQASNGKLYGVCGGPAGSGQIYNFDISTNNFNILKTYYNSSNGGTGISGPLVEEKFVASAGEDIVTCSSIATLAAIPNLANAGAGKWTVVSGTATIANADSANTTVTNLAGATTLRYTTNYGACSSSFDDITILSKPAAPTVTNGSRCGTGAGAVTLGATTSSPTGVVNWYAAAAGGTSLGTSNSFTTPSISSTTTYYAEVTDKYNSKNVNFTTSGLGCFSAAAELSDNDFTTGITTTWIIGQYSWIKATFDSALTVNAVYVAGGTVCGNSVANNLNGCQIQYSTDDANWNTVSSISGVTNSNGKNKFAISGIKARYWRILSPQTQWAIYTTEFSFDFPTFFSCTSNRVPVTAYIGTTPSIINTTAGIGCSTATLQATPSAGTVKWYAAASGTDTALTTGTSFTTPTLTNNTTYYASAIDGGCESSRTAVTATINVPSITCAANMVVSNTYNQCGATVSVIAPTVNNTCGGAAPTLTNSFNGTANASGNYPIGTTNVVWTATGSNGNTATCTQTITVTDIQSPNVITQNRTIYLDASGSASINANQLNNGSTDNCGISSYSASKTNFTCSDLGANQVILSVTDVNGNTAANAATVTVLDTIRPVISVPANNTVNSDLGKCGAIVSFAATATDNCSGVVLSYSPASGSLFPEGTTLVTATATDASGNSKSATFTVTVVDNQSPVITCPANITVSCTASTDTSITGVARATDNCQLQSITWSDVSTKSANNTLCSYYTYTISRTWTATDNHGNTSNCTQTIMVKDTTKPIITASGSDLNLGCNPTQAAIDAALGTAIATDNCSVMGTPIATDGVVLVNGILRSQTRSFNITDVCGNIATTVTRTANWTVLAPASIHIAAGANGVCHGATVSFDATTTSGGTAPAYQWTKNGININAATSNTYSYVPENGDVIACVMTATNACQTNVVVSSNTITMVVKANTSSISNVSICAASLPYSWNGLTFTDAGTQTAHLTNAAGCDSAATLNLAINSISTSTTNISICTNQLPYSWNGLTFTDAGTQTAHLTNAVGCDSLATLVLTVNVNTTSTTNAAICSGNSYEFNGTNYTTAGTYTFHTTNSVGCDSAATLILVVKSLSTSTTNISICPSTLPYSWNGLTFTTAGTQTAHLTNAVGCDSAATLNLMVLANTTSISNESVCPASLPYNWNGLTFTEAGTQTAHLTNAAGCDSAATLNLTVSSISTSTSYFSICAAQLPYSWNGLSFNGTGSKTAHLTNAVGCDSLATLVLTVNSSTTSTTSTSICLGASYSFNGTNYTTAGTYTYHTTNSLGCDSAAILNLTVNAPSASTTNISICPSALPFSWNGLSFTEAGSQTAHLTNAVGCDSAATLNLTVKATSSSTTNSSICEVELPYSWNGLTFHAAGMQTAHLTNAVGCDSLATLVLTVNSSTRSTISASICLGASYSFNGMNYTSAGTYTYHTTNSLGCDSAAILNLTVNTPSASTTDISICPSALPFSWNGLSFTETGSQTSHLTNAVGCDSAATLNLTVKATSTSTTNLSICEVVLPYSWNGLTFHAAGTQTAHLTNSLGCDSLATLVLTLKSNTMSTTNASICNGSSYSFNGTTYTTAGTYTYHTINSVGCDSLAKLVLTVNSSTTSVTNAVICIGSSYSFNRTNYTIPGTYTYHTTNSAGCDSIATLNLSISGAPITQNLEIADCKTVTYKGVTYTANTAFLDTVKTVNGCDSIYRTVNIYVGFQAGITVNKNVTCGSDIAILTGKVFNANSIQYQWFKNGVAIVGATTISYRTTASLTGDDYQLRVRSKDPYCSNKTFDTVYSNIIRVVSMPTLPVKVTIVASATKICAGTNVSFTAITVNAAANLIYVWKLNGGVVGTNTATYSSSTLNNRDVVTCEVSNTNPCTVITNSISNPITMEVAQGSLVPLTAITGNTNICSVGSTTTLMESVTGGTWTSSSTSVATVNSSGLVTATGAGITTISYTTGSGFCSSAVTAIVNVAPIKLKPITGPTSVCQGSSVQLNDSTPGGVWSLTNARATISPNGLLTGTTSGANAIVAYTVTNNFGCSSKLYYNVYVNPLPAKPLLSTPVNGPYCLGSSFQLTPTIPGGTWVSNTASGTISNTGLLRVVDTNNISIVYTTAPDANGCVNNTIYNRVVFKVAPIWGNLGLCTIGATTQLTDTSNPRGIWNSTNKAVATVTNLGLVKSTGVGTTNITYTIDTASCHLTVSAVVNVLPLAMQNITGPTTVCQGSSVQLANSTVGTGVWAVTNARGAITPTGLLTGKLAGGNAIVTYAVTNVAGCTATRYYNVMVNPPCIAREAIPTTVEPISKMSIYPNPARGIVIIDNGQLIVDNNTKLFITDITGKLVKSQTVTERQTKVNTTGFKSGVYLVTLQSAEGKTTEKLVVE